MKYCQLVVGPAGSGKSTFCTVIQNHCKVIRRNVFVVNLDPAAECFNYECSVDVRDLISVEDVMEDKKLALGPNGALIYCMEYLVENLSWLHEQLNETEDDYFLFDCPGQIELYSHLPAMRYIADALKEWGFNVCTTFLLDATFCLDASKFLAASLTTLSTMVALETPSVNVLTKMDLLGEEGQESIEEFLEESANSLVEQVSESPWNIKYKKLTGTIASVIEDYSLVKFVPLNADDEEAVGDLMNVIDATIQYGEDLDVKDSYPEEVDPRDET